MAKKLQYTIKGIIWVDPEEPSEVTEVLDKIREYGTAEVEAVELVDDPS